MNWLLRVAAAKPRLLLLVALLQLLVVWANGSRYRVDQNLQDQAIVLTDAEQVMRDHYEAYPYPSASLSTFESVRGASLADVDHWLYGGAGDFGNVGIRILNAGGGTGQATCLIAKELAERDVPGGLIVHLDLSLASIRVAKQRCQMMGEGVLERVHFVQGSLLHLGTGRLAPVMPGGVLAFDFVLCTGVLHHLSSPRDGLLALGAALAPGGGILVMVYGKYGRTGIYELQDALRLVAPATESKTERVRTTREILEALPATNWLKTNLGSHDARKSKLVDVFSEEASVAWTWLVLVAVAMAIVNATFTSRL